MLLQADLPISYKNGLTDNRGFIEMATGRCRSNVAARTEESHQNRKTLPNSKKKELATKHTIPAKIWHAQKFSNRIVSIIKFAIVIALLRANLCFNLSLKRSSHM